MSNLMFLSREEDSDGVKQWKCGHAKIMSGNDEVIAYLDNQFVSSSAATVICDLLKLDWAGDTEIETFGVAFEVAPILSGADVAAIVITSKQDIELWGF